MTQTPAIPASTLVVVRDGPGREPELLMVERARAMAFAAGALVFPGGRIDDADRQLASSFDVEHAAARIAAVRETIEETAIPAGLSPVPSRGQALTLQQALIADADFGQLLAQQELRLDLEALTPLARWVPKFHATRRFDTMFFVARAPAAEWEPAIVEGECTDASWISAAEALKRDRDGSAQLIFPTRRNLERLAQHGSFEAIRADARSHLVEPITPWVEQVDGENFITIPENAGYPVTREKLDGLWRG